MVPAAQTSQSAKGGLVSSALPSRIIGSLLYTNTTTLHVLGGDGGPAGHAARSTIAGNALGLGTADRLCLEQRRLQAAAVPLDAKLVRPPPETRHLTWPRAAKLGLGLLHCRRAMQMQIGPSQTSIVPGRTCGVSAGGCARPMQDAAAGQVKSAMSCVVGAWCGRDSDKIHGHGHEQTACERQPCLIGNHGIVQSRRVRYLGRGGQRDDSQLARAGHEIGGGCAESVGLEALSKSGQAGRRLGVLVVPS